MKYVLFDLETSDKEFVGQILTYAFVCVDQNFELVSQLEGSIKVSKTQMPAPYAIMANRIDVVKLNEYGDSEYDAMKRIHKYLTNIGIEDSFYLVGYNSAKFDVPFLRTSMIRVGLNPYIKNMGYVDAMHMVNCLNYKDRPFNAHILVDPKKNRKSLTLENVTKSLGLLALDQKQTHNAMDDVRLLFKLVRFMAKSYDLRINGFTTYEPEKGKYKIYNKYSTNYETGEQITEPFVRLTEGKTQALWINLEKYKTDKSKASVFWFNKATSPFFIESVVNEDYSPEVYELAVEAIENLSDITLDNYFDKQECDIEQHIYGVSFDGIRALDNAIARGDRSLINTPELAKLYIRAMINGFVKDQDVLCEAVFGATLDYARYRYTSSGDSRGNRLRLDKNSPVPVYHETLNQYIKQATEIMVNGTEQDVELMQSLLAFYVSSCLYVAVQQNEETELVG